MKLKRFLVLGITSLFCVAAGVSQVDARRGGGGHHHGGGFSGGGKHHHGGGGGYYGGWYPYYGYYAPYYAYPYYDDDECAWLYRKARRTGSRYWWRRYYQCID